MAHQSMRVNLASVIFPFTKDLWGRSIIIPQYDENYERALVSSADIGKDKGVPMACYLHNCMPTTEGYQSIGFIQNALGVINETTFDRVFSLLQTTPNAAHFLLSPAGGKNYIFDGTVGFWQSISPFSGGVGPATIVTTSYVQGLTYIYYSKLGCFVYDSVLKVLTPTTLTGLVASTVIGLVSAYGYNIAFNENTVAWSNATNPVDFVPSLITGAGGGNVNDIKGNIICCVQITGGFLIYCEKNVVAAKYTGNIRFPFIFKELAGSSGITSPDQISYGTNLSEHYAWTNAGLQMLTINSATNEFPECSDFLSKLIYEDFDDLHLIWTEQSLSTPLAIKVAIISERFIVISYGVTSGVYTYAVIYDSVLKRWGKIKVTHVAAFQWNSPNLFGNITYGQLGVLGLTYGGLAGLTYGQLATSINTPELPLETLAFIQADGSVLVVDFSLSGTNSLGTILLGKFQFQRNKFITHQWSDVENIGQGNPFALYVVPTLDGKTLLTPVPGIPTRIKPTSQRWNKRVSGQNISLLMQGAFNLTSVILDFTVGGDR